MLPNKFATNVGHRTVVCRALDNLLGGEAVNPAFKEPLILRFEASVHGNQYFTRSD